jgi:uncharacterized protein (TIGR03437 family)
MSIERKVLQAAHFALVLGLFCATGVMTAATNPVQLGAVVDSASLAPNRALAPGSLVTLFGTGLALSEQSAGRVPLPTTLGSTRVIVNGVAAPLLFVSPRQINLQLPFELTGTQASLLVSVNGVVSDSLVVSLIPNSPALFTLLSNGSGPGAMLHTDCAAAARRSRDVVHHRTGVGGSTHCQRIAGAGHCAAFAIDDSTASLL